MKTGDLEEQRERCGSLSAIEPAVDAWGVRDWDKAISWKREVRRGRSVESTGDQDDCLAKAATDILLQRWA